MRYRILTLICIALLVTACGSDSVTDSSVPSQLYPDVIDVTVTASPDGTYRFDVTISSPYDSDERYADAWRVKDRSGEVFGIRELTHPHANEQPFTRSLAGVEVPDDVDAVVVEARDSLNGWGGETMELNLP